MSIVPLTASIAEELGLIEATHRLTRLYAQFTFPGSSPPHPLQIRLHSDRLEFISKFLKHVDSARASSLDFNILIELSKKLNGSTKSNDDIIIELRVRGIIANWALDNRLPNIALKVCMELIIGSLVKKYDHLSDSILNRSESVEDTWRACIRLINEASSYLSEYQVQELLGFSMEHCEPRHMPEILDLARKVELISSIRDQKSKILLEGATFESIKNNLISLMPQTSGNFLQHGTVFSKHEFYIDKNVDTESLNMHQLYGVDVDSSRKVSDFPEVIIRIQTFINNSKPLLRSRKKTFLLSDDHSENPFDVRNVLYDFACSNFSKGDSGLAFAALVEFNNSERALDFLDSLDPCRSNDLFAMYFLSLESIIKLSGSDTLKELLTVNPCHVFKFADAIYPIISSTPMYSDSASLLLEASKFSSRSTISRQSTIIKSIIDLPGVESSRFHDDAEYRHRILFQIACTFNKNNIINDMLVVSASFGIPPSHLALAHIIWALESTESNADTVLKGFQEFKDLINSNDAIDKLLSIHGKVIICDIIVFGIHILFSLRQWII